MCPPDLIQVFAKLGNLHWTSNYVVYRIHVGRLVKMLSIPVLLLAYSQDWTCNFHMIITLESLGINAYNRYAMCPGHIGRNVWEIIKIKTIVRKPLMIKIKLHLKDSDN